MESQSTDIFNSGDHGFEDLGDKIIYGINPITEAITTENRTVEKVFFANKDMSARVFEIMKEVKKKKINYQIVDLKKLKLLAKTDDHQGVVAICTIKPYNSVAEILEYAKEQNEIPLIVVGDSIEDPRNLGALIRTSLGAGVHGIILPKQGGCGLTSSVAKSSAGAIESMLIAKPSDIEEELKNLAKDGFDVIGLTIKGTSLYNTQDFSRPTVVVIGGEDKGIRPHILRACTKHVTIPLNANCHSLNLSVAAGVILFEIVRKRNL